jgi:hypothetical protein
MEGLLNNLMAHLTVREMLPSSFIKTWDWVGSFLSRLKLVKKCRVSFSAVHIFKLFYFL